jgi:Transcriptional regulators
MLFEHFRQRGFQRFAFVGIPRQEHSSMDVRRDHFRKLVTERNYPFDELEISMSDFEGSGSTGDRCLRRWFKKLPHRTAILACNDDLGLQILNSCHSAGVVVPDMFAVAGIGNDECLCEVCSPKLTSIDLNPIQVGIEAATLLQKMMIGQVESPASIRITPNRIVPRNSTNTVACDDPVVSAMIQYIRQEACNGITPKNVLIRSKISRSSLENKFKESIGHSLFQEIIAVRLERVQELLVFTDLTIREISEQTGFNYQGYLMQTFQKQFGMTMKAFRKTYRVK